MSIKNFERKVEEKIEIALDCRIEKRKQRHPDRRKLIKNIHLTQKQKAEIDSFFKKYYGKKINYSWHRLYTSVSGKFDYKYFPELLYSSKLQRLTNSELYESVSDKTLFPVIVKGSGLSVTQPKTYFYKSNNILFNSQHQPISLDEAFKTVSRIEFFIKPAIGSNSGNGCKLINTDDFSIQEFRCLLSDYGTDCIAQEVVHNQNDIRSLNPSSLNTFRIITYLIITYLIDGKAYSSPIVLKVGANGNVCDNAHAGGLFCAVDDNGDIISNGKMDNGLEFDKHPNSGITFFGYHIDNVAKLKQTAISLQYLFPRIGVIDWDLTINENGDIVVIEANMRGGSVWLIQMSHGQSVFGDNTDKILTILKEKKKKY